MEIPENIAELFHPPNHCFRPDRAIGPDNTQKILSLYIIHDDINALFILDDIDDPDNVRMIEPPQHFHLGQKAPPGSQVLQEPAFRDLLDRPGLVDPLVARQVDKTHPAAPDLL